MKIQVDDETELANSVKLSEADKEILGKTDEEEASSKAADSQDKTNSD